MNPGLNLNQTDMPQRPCVCSAWNTCVALRFPAANGEKRNLSNSPGLTSYKRFPGGSEVKENGQHFHTLGPMEKISSRSYMKANSASGEVNFSAGLS